jgi:hypothetical protein
VIFLAEKHAPDALAVSTGRRVERLVSSGRVARIGVEQAVADCCALACPVHVCVDIVRQRPVEVTSARG